MRSKESFALMVGFFLISLWAMLSFSAAFAQQAPKPDKVWEITIAHHVPIKHHLHPNCYVPLKEELEKKSNGRLKVTIYPAAALGKPEAEYDLCVKGMVDIAMFLPEYTPGIFPLADIPGLPFAMPNAEVGRKVTMKLMEKRLLDKMLSEKIVSWLGTTSAYQVFTSKKKVAKVEDLKGLRLRVPGGILKETMIALGATPATLPGAEFQTGVERGVVEGGIVALSTATGYKLQDVCKYVCIANLGVSVLGIAMNKAKYNSIPADLRKILDKSADDFLVNQAKSFDGEDSKAVEVFKNAGAQILALDPAEKERWVKTCAPIYGKWVKDIEAKGLPGKKLYAEFRSIVKEEGIELPQL